MNNIYIWNINLLKIIKIFFNHDINKLKYKKYKNIFFINLIKFNKFLYEICNLIFYSSKLNKQILIINTIFTKKNNKFLLNLILYITIKSKCFYYLYNKKNKKLPDILIILEFNNLIKKKFIFFFKYIFLKIIIINLKKKIINNLLFINNIIDIDILFINNKFKIIYILYKFKFAILEGISKIANL
uniref:ribosomal protein S2 n=1 Tax=Balanophora yakushimensis TaxID=1128105 RepID=UPI002001CFF6|nr:ribosomal protein S2 [Balanophora yakushimensis]UNQ87781.1 ribosomal protein S2 [Balanophora yakushimensis]